MISNFTPCRKILHNDRLYLMTKSTDNETIPNQMSYYRELSKIDKFQVNIPSDLKLHSTHCLSMDASSFCQETDSEKTISKVLALMNKMSSVSAKNFDTQPKPNTRQIYLDKMKNFMDIHQKDSAPYKEWIINGKIYSDLFNTKLYMDLIEVIISKMNGYSPKVTHGNFSLDNLQKVGNNLIIINPRASFGNGPSVLGDPRCDIAKMKFYISDIVNILRNERFIITRNESNIFDYQLLSSSASNKLLNVINAYIEENFDPIDISIFEGCLHILLMNYFKDKISRKILYARAIEILVPAIEKYFSVF